MKTALQKLVWRSKGSQDVRATMRQLPLGGQPYSPTDAPRAAAMARHDERDADIMLQCMMKADYFYFEGTQKTAENPLFD